MKSSAAILLLILASIVLIGCNRDKSEQQREFERAVENEFRNGAEQLKLNSLQLGNWNTVCLFVQDDSDDGVASGKLQAKLSEMKLVATYVIPKNPYRILAFFGHSSSMAFFEPIFEIDFGDQSQGYEKLITHDLGTKSERDLCLPYSKAAIETTTTRYGSTLQLGEY